MRALAKSTGRKQGVAFAVLGLIWGTTWVGTDALNEGVPPLMGTAARFFLAALILLPLIRWKRWKFPRGRALVVTLLLSRLHDGHARPAAFLGSAVSAIRNCGCVIRGDAPHRCAQSSGFTPVSVPPSAMNAAILGLGGILLALGPSFSLAQTGAAALVLGAVVLTGASSLIVRRELMEVHPVVMTALVLGAASPLLLLASLFLEQGQAVHWDGSSLGAVIFLAVAPGAVAYATWFWLLQRREAYQMATMQWLEPLVSLAEGAALLRIGWSFNMLAGAALALLSLWMAIACAPRG